MHAGYPGYIVAQYCGGQNALVRLSQSRMEYPLSRMRGHLLRVVKGLPERYEFGNRLWQSMGDIPASEISKLSNHFLWSEFREAWTDLVRSRSCQPFGVRLAWLDGALGRV